MERLLEQINGQDLFDEILDGSLSAKCKQEIVEWLCANRKLDDEQYKLAVSRVLHVAEKP